MNQREFKPWHTLEEVQDFFFAEIQHPEGADCPCCGRFGKIYCTPLNRGMARSLIWLYQRKPDFVHLPSTAPRHILSSNSTGKLLFWGMVERMKNEDDPTKNKTGWYRITSVGEAFIEGRITANSHVFLFNDDAVGWRDTQITISDALGKPFNYQDLMQDNPGADR